MSGWRVWTWLAVLILGPGALAVFVFFLRDIAKLLREIKREKTNSGP